MVNAVRKVYKRKNPDSSSVSTPERGIVRDCSAKLQKIDQTIYGIENILK